MKLRILSLLASASFVDYLEGVELFATSIAERSLPQREIDSELMERACAIVGVERWAEHEDYVEKIEYFVERLPQYGDLLMQDDAVGQALRGIVLFINGIAQGQHNTGGFKADGAATSGWLLSQAAGERIAQYYAAQSRYLDGAFFTDLADWFGAVGNAQTGFIAALRELADWNEDNAGGFFNVLPMADPFFQGLLLDALQPVAHLPIVQTEIFDKYLDLLHQTRDTMLAADEAAQAADTAQMIALVQSKRTGTAMP